MTYNPEVGPAMQRIGMTPREACLVCDGCGKTHPIGPRGKAPSQWFIDGIAPCGWFVRRPEGRDGPRLDYCATCGLPPPAPRCYDCSLWQGGCSHPYYKLRAPHHDWEGCAAFAKRS
jgi:hypothetical protein